MSYKLEEPVYTNKVLRSMSDEEILKLISEYMDHADETMAKLVNTEALMGDIMFASQNKRKRQYVTEIIGDDWRDSVINPESRLYKSIHPVQLLLLTDSFRVPEHKVFTIRDISNTKDRDIIKPNFAYEQIIHHAIIRMILPILQKGMYKYTCASIPNRGIHYVVKHVKKILSNDPKNTKYVLKMDIRKFFDSIPHRLLKKRLRKSIKDETLRRLLFRIIDSTDRGLPLGFYTSQWLANVYLQDLDHYIKERILVDCGCNVERTGRYGAVYYYRYMDDMVIFGPNKKELHKMRKQIAKYIYDNYGLNIKYDWQIFRFDHIDKKTGERKGRPLDYVGYQFFRDKTTVRKRTFKRMKHLIKHLVKIGIENVSFHEAAAMLSYYGILTWSNSMGIYTKLLKPHITLKELKDIVRKEMKSRKTVLA